MVKMITNNLSMQLLSQNKLECLFIGLFFSNGIVISLLTLLGLFSSTLWLLFGGSLLIFALISVYLTQKSTVSLYIIIIFQFFIRLPFLLRDFYFLYETDEMYHFGLALIKAFFPNKLPIERMIGYSFYPLMDTITAQLLKVFGISITMVLIKLFYGIIIPIIVVILIDSVYKQLGKENSFRIATLIFSSCYRFLFFFSLYIFETGTILLFVALLWVICSISAMKKFNILFYVFSLLLLIGFFLLGMWHYNGVFMGNIMLFVYYALMRVETKNQSKKWETRFDFIFIIYFVVINWYILVDKNVAGYFTLSVYLGIIMDVIPFLSASFRNLGLLIVLEIGMIIILVLAFIILSKIIVLVQQTISLCLEWLEKIQIKNINKIFLVTTIIIEIMLFIASVSFYTYYGFSDGFRTIGDFGFFTVLTFYGLIHFFILALFSIRWIVNEKQRIFYYLFCVFLMLTIITFIYRPTSNPTFPYRMIIYVFLFGTPLATISLKRGVEFLLRSFPTGNFRVHRITFNKSLKFEQIFRTCSLILLLLIMSQAVTLARWEGYTSAYTLPREDIFYMSAWMRVNLDQTDQVFIEFIYSSISTYSLIDRARSSEIQILLSLYYQRNISRVIEFFWSNGITYLIFDLASIHPRFMTKIYRDHILTSYGVPSSSLQNFNGTQPNEFEIVFRTKHLALLKVPTLTQQGVYAS